jgi:hypothetical protein
MKKMSTSKLIMAILIANFVILQVFTGYVTVEMLKVATQTGVLDFTPLVTLISTIVGEIGAYLIYAHKSAKENTQGGIVYETAMADLYDIGCESKLPDEDGKEAESEG